MADTKGKTTGKYEGVSSFESSAEAEKPPKPPYRMLQTVCLQFVWFCVGIFAEISGPTLTFLKDRISADFEEISRALVARGVGFLVGSLLGGALCQRWPKVNNIWVASGLVVGGVATGFQPWSDGLVTLAILFFLDGFAKGVSCTAANAAIFILWKTKAAVPTHVMHCCFGIGALLAPQIARPFLPDPEDPSCKDRGNGTTVAPTNSSSADDGCGDQGEEHIEYAYIIVGVLTILGAIILYIVHCVVVRNTKEDTSADDADNKDKEQSTMAIIRQNKVVAILLLGLFALLWAFPVGEERAIGKFIFAFATESELQFAPKKASDLVMVFWATFTSGRALAAVLSRWLAPLQLLSIELSLGILSSAVLAFCGHNQPIPFWIFTAVFAATLSPIFPAAMTWTNLHIPMTAVLTSFAFIATAAGAVSFSYLSGSLFQRTGPRSLMHLSLAYAIISSVLVIVIFLILRFFPLKKGGDGDEEEPMEGEKEEMTTKMTTAEA